MQLENPWLNIPVEEYEKHMSAQNVGQLQALNEITRRKLEYLRPISLAILGCATGNGFEYVNTQITRRVFGVDINKNYLDVAQERYGAKINNLQLINADLNTDEIKITEIDLIIAGLIFEYLDIPASLKKIKTMLACDGTLIVVLQHSIKTDFVSETVYDSMKSLSGIGKNVNEFDFNAMAAKQGFIRINRELYNLNEHKEFIILTFRKG